MADHQAPRIPYLLRKSRTGQDVPVLRSHELPIRFRFGEKNYVVNRTKAGGIILTTE